MLVVESQRGKGAGVADLDEGVRGDWKVRRAGERREGGEGESVG